MNLSGFRGTPLTRLLISLLVGLSLLVSLTNTKHHFHLQLRPHLLHYHQFSRILLWQTIYANSGELLFACAVLYNLRVVERLFGTRKFASFLAVAWVWTGVAAVVVLLGMNLLMVGGGWGGAGTRGNVVGGGVDGGRKIGGNGGGGGGGGARGGGTNYGGKGWNYLPPGPTAVVFALLAQYHAAVPSVYKIRFLSSTTPTPTTPPTSSTSTSSSQPPPPHNNNNQDEPSITLSDKLPLYILASQLSLSQPPGSLIAALVGWIYGYAYRAEIVPGARWRVPAWLFDRSGGEYEGLRRRLAAGEFAAAAAAGGAGMGGDGDGDGAGGQQQAAAAGRRPLMGQILDQFRGAF
ncbi:hypothetical protein DFH27DRAFT_248342 [Peziza echinospora]|nr:hypothetical protein DFH27DRAFT_248342 [Peziza echinospora]